MSCDMSIPYAGTAEILLKVALKKQKSIKSEKPRDIQEWTMQRHR